MEGDINSAQIKGMGSVTWFRGLENIQPHSHPKVMAINVLLIDQGNL